MSAGTPTATSASVREVALEVAEARGAILAEGAITSGRPLVPEREREWTSLRRTKAERADDLHLPTPSLLLLTIVTTFLVCQIPRIFLAFYRVGLVATVKS